MGIVKKLTWIIKRHPYLYYIRFKLLSRNGTIDSVQNYSYNLINRKEDLPKIFYEVNKQIFYNSIATTDLDKATCISIWLRNHIDGGSGLSLSSTKALQKMLQGEGGVCSDISQVFNNFCVVNSIEVKEWGMTSLPYDKEFGGHAFNEFYSKELKKWVLIDVSKTTLFYDEDLNIPSSVLEVFTNHSTPKKLMFKSFLDSNTIDESLIKDYYLNPMRVPFLICNYSNKIYDGYLDRFKSFVPIFVIHFWLYLSRQSYYYMFPLHDCENNFSYNSKVLIKSNTYKHS